MNRRAFRPQAAADRCTRHRLNDKDGPGTGYPSHRDPEDLEFKGMHWSVREQTWRALLLHNDKVTWSLVHGMLSIQPLSSRLQAGMLYACKIILYRLFPCGSKC